MRLSTLALLVFAPIAVAQTPPPPSSDPVPKGAYVLDKAHASLLFRVKHLGFSNFTGRFTGFDARLDFDPRQPGAARVSVTIDPRSISTDNAPDGFLDTLSGEEFLDAGKHPQMTFVSRAVDVVSPGQLVVRGELTLHGVTRPLDLTARYNGGYASHPFEPNARIGFSAQGSLKRSDFGITAGIPAPGSLFGVSDEVEVVIEAEFTGPAAKGVE